jgi:hypothetical protein
MHAPAQSLVPPPHSPLHFVPSQVALPFIGASHGVQDVPQLPGSPLLTHASPHRWYPALHLRSQVSPLQLATPLGDVGQGMQAVPHALKLLASTQSPPPHGFVLGGHVPSHGAPSGTHLSRHSFDPIGQKAPHFVPSQVAVPPATGGQGEQPRPQ